MLYTYGKIIGEQSLIQKLLSQYYDFFALSDDHEEDKRKLEEDQEKEREEERQRLQEEADKAHEEAEEAEKREKDANDESEKL